MASLRRQGSGEVGTATGHGGDQEPPPALAKEEKEGEVAGGDILGDENDLVDEGLQQLWLNPELLSLEEEYNAIAAALPLEAAKAIAWEAAEGGEADAQLPPVQDAEDSEGSSRKETRRAAGGMWSVYGEMGWWAMVGIFESIARHGGLPSGPAAFVDLGAGSGKALAAAGLLRCRAALGSHEALRTGGWASLRGIECSQPLHSASLAVAKAWAATGREPALELQLGDACKFPLEGAALVLAHSTAFGDELMEAIAQAAEQALRPGAWLASCSRPLPRAAARGWDVVEARRRTVSWGAATVFLHRRRAPEVSPCCTLCDAPSLDSEEDQQYRSQVWFHCKACGLVGSSGVCAPCAATCHAECAGVEFAAHSPFFCDCGDGCRGCRLSAS